MKKKYIKPKSAIYDCGLESSLMTGSNTGTIPVGGTGTKPRYAPRHEDNSGIFGNKVVVDEVDYNDMWESPDKAALSDLW